MSEWSAERIDSTGFVSHTGTKGYEIHFETPDREKYLAVEGECRRQIGHGKPNTNADRIRAMTDEELANYLYELTIYGCPDHGARDCVPSCEACWLDWLRQEARE